MKPDHTRFQSENVVAESLRINSQTDLKSGNQDSGDEKAMVISAKEQEIKDYSSVEPDISATAYKNDSRSNSSRGMQQ